MRYGLAIDGKVVAKSRSLSKDEALKWWAQTGGESIRGAKLVELNRSSAAGAAIPLTARIVARGSRR